MEHIKTSRTALAAATVMALSYEHQAAHYLAHVPRERVRAPKPPVDRSKVKAARKQRNRNQRKK